MNGYRSQDPRIHAFFKHLFHHERRKEHVAKEYAREVERFALFLEPGYTGGPFATLYRATADDVSRYVDRLTSATAVRPATIIRKIAFLHAFFAREMRAGRCSADPTAGVTLPDRPQRTANVLTPEELQRFFAAVESEGTLVGLRDLAIVHALCNGFKRSELETLRVTDYDGRSGVVCVGSGRTRRTLALPEPARAAFDAYLNARPRVEEPGLFLSLGKRAVTGRQVWSRLKHYGGKAGLGRNLTSFALRDSYLVHTLMDDVGELLAVSKNNGHRSLHDTQPLLEKAAELRRTQEKPGNLGRPDDALFDALDFRRAKQIWFKAQQRLSADPAGALALARTSIETVARGILARCGKRYKPDEGLSDLCNMAIVACFPSVASERGAVVALARRASALVEVVANLRDAGGDLREGLHGVPAGRQLAEFAVNVSGATVAYLLECYRVALSATRQAKRDVTIPVRKPSKHVRRGNVAAAPPYVEVR